MRAFLIKLINFQKGKICLTKIETTKKMYITMLNVGTFQKSDKIVFRNGETFIIYSYYYSIKSSENLVQQ